MLLRHVENYGEPPQPGGVRWRLMRRGRIWQTPRSWAWSTWCSTKKCGLEQTDMTPSAWIYGQLKRFRAGLEAGISYSEAVLRSDRCNWRGWEHFQAYEPPWLSMLRSPFKRGPPETPAAQVCQGIIG